MIELYESNDGNTSGEAGITVITNCFVSTISLGFLVVLSSPLQEVFFFSILVLELVQVWVEATPSVVVALAAGVCATPVAWSLRAAMVKILAPASTRRLVQASELFPPLLSFFGELITKKHWWGIDPHRSSPSPLI